MRARFRTRRGGDGSKFLATAWLLRRRTARQNRSSECGPMALARRLVDELGQARLVRLTVDGLERANVDGTHGPACDDSIAVDVNIENEVADLGRCACDLTGCRTPHQTRRQRKLNTIFPCQRHCGAGRDVIDLRSEGSMHDSILQAQRTCWAWLRPAADLVVLAVSIVQTAVTLTEASTSSIQAM